MVFGHNTNLKLGSVTLHIQTEDRGEPHRQIDTIVYYRGRVLHRRLHAYADLLPMNEEREQLLRVRLDDQHRTVIEEIRSGVLRLEIPAETPRTAQVPEPPAAPAEPKKLALVLSNAKSWLAGKHAKLEIVVKEPDGAPAGGAKIAVEFEGSEGGETIQGQTDAHGAANIEFELPRIVNPEAAMVIRAENRNGTGYLRFALRAKPRMVTK